MSARIIKKLLCLFSVFMLLYLSVPAMAEGINLNTIDDHQLIELHAQLNAEIVNRGIMKTATLARGAYIAGKDIPCGSYIYTCRATGSDWGNVTIYSDGGSGKQLLWEIVSAPDQGEEPETIYMTLHEGDQLKSGVPFSLTISVGALFR